MSISLSQLLDLQSEFKLQKQCSVMCRQDLVVSVNYSNLAEIGAFFQNYIKLPKKVTFEPPESIESPMNSPLTTLTNSLQHSDSDTDSSNSHASFSDHDSIEYSESINTFTPITLSLETIKNNQHIHYDLTNLGVSTESLLSLTMYARYNHIIPLDWSIETTLNLLFIVKPLGLYRCFVNDLLKRVASHLNYGPELNDRILSYIKAVENIIRNKDWSDVEYVLGLVNGLKTLVSRAELVCIDCSKDVCLVHKMGRLSIAGVPVFVGENLIEADTGVAMMIIAATWLSNTSRQVKDIDMMNVRDAIQKMRDVMYCVPKTVESCLMDHAILPFWKFLL